MSGRARDLRFYGGSEVAGEIHSPAGANNGCTVLFGNGVCALLHFLSMHDNHWLHQLLYGSLQSWTWLCRTLKSLGMIKTAHQTSI